MHLPLSEEIGTRVSPGIKNSKRKQKQVRIFIHMRHWRLASGVATQEMGVGVGGGVTPRLLCGRKQSDEKSRGPI